MIIEMEMKFFTNKIRYLLSVNYGCVDSNFNRVMFHVKHSFFLKYICETTNHFKKWGTRLKTDPSLISSIRGNKKQEN